MIGGGRRGDKVLRVAGPGGWDGVDSCYWVSYQQEQINMTNQRISESSNRMYWVKLSPLAHLSSWTEAALH